MALRRGHLECGANCWPDAVTSSHYAYEGCPRKDKRRAAVRARPSAQDRARIAFVPRVNSESDWKQWTNSPESKPLRNLNCASQRSYATSLSTSLVHRDRTRSWSGLRSGPSPEKHNVVSKQIHARLRRPLSDCAGTIIYSGRRMVFLEGHWLAPISCRVCYRIVADLGSTAMDCREDCGGVSQKMIFTLTKFGPAKIGAASI